MINEAGNYVSYCSFLSGILIKYKSITFYDFERLKEVFFKVTDVEVIDVGVDFPYEDILDDLISTDNNRISLKLNYEDIIPVDGEYTTVYDFLYNCTDRNIRGFLDIPEKIKNNHKK